MSFSIQYKELFRVNILHNFFLDKGLTEFKEMEADEQAEQLKKYDSRSVFTIVPTAQTVHLIRGHHLFFKETNRGFMLWTKANQPADGKPFIELDNDMNLTFLLKIKDPQFFNYTALNAEKIDGLYFFSNRKPETEPSGFPLIRKEGATQFVTEANLLSESGKKLILKKLEKSEQLNVFGLIRIFMRGESSLHLVGTTGKFLSNAPVFELKFKNQSTVWRYIFNSNQVVSGSDDVKQENGNPKMLITAKAYPLTSSGFISLKFGDKELPNPGISLIKPAKTSNNIFSEIYM